MQRARRDAPQDLSDAGGGKKSRAGEKERENWIGWLSESGSGGMKGGSRGYVRFERKVEVVYGFLCFASAIRRYFS